jgi:hypothetical protein
VRTVTSCALLDGSPSRRGWQLREIVNEGENKWHWTRRRLLCNLNTGSRVHRGYLNTARGAFAQGQFSLESCEGRDGAVGGRCSHSVIAVAMIVHSESPIPDVMTGIGMEAGCASPHAHLPAGLNPPGLAMTARAH